MRAELAGGDPLSPPAARDAAFDPVLNAWVLGKYADVLAAFREPRLWPAGPRNEKNSKIPDHAAQQRIRADVQTAFSPSQLAEWRARLAPLADGLSRQLPRDRPVDVVQEFAEPWCLSAAEIVTGSEPAERAHLLAQARIVSASAAEPLEDELQSEASMADRELERILATASIPLAGPTFVALSRTLVCLLANGWLALLRQPEGLLDLRSHPDLMPRAIEELLRFACIPQMLFRRASEDVELNGLRIAAGERLILMLATANRDPVQFAHPEQLNWYRRGAAQLSLGLGPHSCVGGPLIRMAMAVITSSFVDRFAQSALYGPVEWQGGSGFRFPASVWVVDQQ
ncbi:MAG TPA: cytochrome P450 [Bryobacteraceae bacterium]|nr:cytochrome P450 [Bryobacteraceae bacterium]HZU42638.1 cytochrome P450 [Terriglobales bacterium]